MATLWKTVLQLEKLFITETGEGIDTETGEVMDASYIDELLNTKEEKLRNITLLFKDIDADLERLDKELKRLNGIKKTLKNRQESLKNYVGSVLQGEKWEAEDFSCKISYRLSRDVVTVDDITAIPSEYFKTPHYESNLDKTAIKTAIKEGNVIAGVHLQDNNNIQIK